MLSLKTEKKVYKIIHCLLKVVSIWLHLINWIQKGARAPNITLSTTKTLNINTKF